MITSSSADQLKVGILLPGSMSDNGYNADGGRAAQALKTELHVDTQTTENVSVANQADLYRQYAIKGFDVVIGWGGRFATDGAVQVAQEFPRLSLSSSTVGWRMAITSPRSTRTTQTGNSSAGSLPPRCRRLASSVDRRPMLPGTAATLHGVEQGTKFYTKFVHKSIGHLYR